jgi:predicted DNA-binding transcriptional regulator YafY
LIPPEQLAAVPGTKGAKSQASKAAKGDSKPLDADKVKTIIDKAMAQEKDLDMVYRSRNGQALSCTVQPQRLAFKADAPVLVGLDRKEGDRRTYMLERIEKLKIVAAP